MSLNGEQKGCLVWIFVILLIIGGIALRIHTVKPDVVEGSYPVSKFEIRNDEKKDRHSITVVGESGAALSSFVSLKYFEPLKPNVSHKDATTLLGAPTNSRDGLRILEWQREGYRLEVSHVDTSDETQSSEYYFLRSYPTNLSASDVLIPAIVSQFDSTFTEQYVAIEAQGHTVLVHVKGNRIEQMEWRDYD